MTYEEKVQHIVNLMEKRELLPNAVAIREEKDLSPHAQLVFEEQDRLYEQKNREALVQYCENLPERDLDGLIQYFEAYPEICTVLEQIDQLTKQQRELYTQIKQIGWSGLAQDHTDRIIGVFATKKARFAQDAMDMALEQHPEVKRAHDSALHNWAVRRGYQA
jgi:hypothetical protein